MWYKVNMWYKNENYPNKERAVNALIESVIDGGIEDSNGVKLSDKKLYECASGCVDLRLWCKEYGRIKVCSIIKDAVMKNTGCDEFDEALNKIGSGLGSMCEKCCMQCFLDWCYKKSSGRKPMNWEVKHGWIVEVKNGNGVKTWNGTSWVNGTNGYIKGKVVDYDKVKLVVFEDGSMHILSQELMDNVDKIWNCGKFSECRDECLVWCEA